MEEVLDFVESNTAKNYVISIFAKRLGYTKDITDIGPSNPKKRIHRRWEVKEAKDAKVAVKEEKIST